jgi:hypothetical protein
MDFACQIHYHLHIFFVLLRYLQHQRDGPPPHATGFKVEEYGRGGGGGVKGKGVAPGFPKNIKR